MATGGVNVPHLTETSLPKINNSIRQLAEGRSNATGVVTLTASATTTVVTAVNCASGSSVFLFPTTANAAAAVATTYASTIADGSFTITHANNAQTDRTFRWACLG